MKKCVNCGVELEDNALFCGECGTKQPAEAKKCSQCGAELPDNAKFCFQCGTPVSGAPAAVPAPPPTNTNSDVVVSQPDNDTISITIKGISFNLKLVEGREYGTHGEILDFYIGETPVTQALWMAVTGENPSENNENLQYPVTDLTDPLITSFFIKLQKFTGVKFELPTEKQWEYAYKGGNKSKGYKYAGSDNRSEVGWSGLHPVGELYPNELGLYDMEGNVTEMLKDKNCPSYLRNGLRVVINIPIDICITPSSQIQSICATQQSILNDARNTAIREFESNPHKKFQIEEVQLERHIQDFRQDAVVYRYAECEGEWVEKHLSSIFGEKYDTLIAEQQQLLTDATKAANSYSTKWEPLVEEEMDPKKYGNPKGNYKKQSIKYSIVDNEILIIKGSGKIPDVFYGDERRNLIRKSERSLGNNFWGIYRELHENLCNNRYHRNITKLVFLGQITGIGKNFFSTFKKLDTVILPESLEEIGDNAFNGCCLKHISIPKRLKTIGERAFRGNEIAYLYIPVTLTSIGVWAFWGNDCKTALVPQSTNHHVFLGDLSEITVEPYKSAELLKIETEARRRYKEAEKARIKAEQDAKRKAEEAEKARIKAEEEAKRKAEEAEKARIKAEEEAKRKAEEAEKARIKAEEDAKRKAEKAEKARIKAEEDAKRRAEKEARRKAEKEARIAELQRGIAPLKNKVAEVAPGLEHAKTLLNEKEQMVRILESTIQESEQKIAATEKDIAAFNRRFSVILMRRVDNGLFNSKGTNFDNMLMGLTGATKEQIKNWNQELKRSHRAVIGEQLMQSDAFEWKRAIEQLGGQAIVENPYDDSEAERKMNSYTSDLESANLAMQSAKEALPAAREEVERANADYRNMLDSYNKVYLDMKSCEIELAYLQSNMSLSNFIKEADADESNRGALAVVFGSKYEEFKRAEEEARRKEEEQRQKEEEERRKEEEKARRRAEEERRKAEEAERKRAEKAAEEERKRLWDEMVAKVKGVARYSVGDDIERTYFAVYEKDYTALWNSCKSLSDKINNAIQSDSLHWEEYLTDYYWNKSVLKYAVVNKNTIVVQGRGRIPDVEPEEMFSREGKNKWHIVEEVDDIKEDIKNLVIIGEITHIGARCFNGFEKLENVVIPDCVETIGSSTFSGCTSLKSVILPEKLKTIETEAFQLSGLRHIKFPKTTNKIAERAFYGCKNLESVLVPKTTSVESNVFNGCKKLE